MPTSSKTQPTRSINFNQHNKQTMPTISETPRHATTQQCILAWKIILLIAAAHCTLSPLKAQNQNPNIPEQQAPQPTQPTQPSQPKSPSQLIQPLQPKPPTPPSQLIQPLQPKPPTPPSQLIQPLQPKPPSQSKPPSELIEPLQPKPPTSPSELIEPLQPKPPTQPSELIQPLQPKPPTPPTPPSQLIQPLQPKPPTPPSELIEPLQPKPPKPPESSEKPSRIVVPKVEKILIEFQGLENISREKIRGYIRQKVDGPYQQEYIDESIRLLYETGDFERISTQRKELPNGNYAVIFLVLPKYRILKIEFEGPDKNDIKWLKREIKSKENEALSEALVQQDAYRLFDYLQKKGYAKAKVTHKINYDTETGEGVVVFIVKTDYKFKVRRIILEGNASLPQKQLKALMQTKIYLPLISWLRSSGRLVESKLKADLETLRKAHKAEGFLDVSIDEKEVQIMPIGRESLEIRIKIDEGKRYYLGKVEFENNTLFTKKELRTIFGLKEGSPFSPQKITASARRIQNHYGRLGYLDASINTQRAPTLKGDTIDLTLSIKEGERFYLDSIDIEGNTKTKNEIILRELALSPGGIFDSVRMQTSQNRLRNTRFFKQVQLTPEPTNLPNRRDLRIKLEEANTGQVSFGATIDSIQALVGFVELSQSNFDILNYRSRFQGAGQKLRIRFSFGSETENFTLSFEEPWFRNQPLAVGFRLYHTNTKYDSGSYSQIDKGFELYTRKRLIELIEARLSYENQIIELRNAPSLDPFRSRNDEIRRRGSHTLGLRLTRDTRDRFLLPKKGNQVQYIFEYTGQALGGAIHLDRHALQYKQYFPLTRSKNHILSFNFRAATILPKNDETPPISERYFLGGPNDLRGFEYREVGPRNASGDVIGGNTLGLFQAEYSFRLSNVVGLKFFYEAGFINAEKRDWDTKNYHDDYGFGLIFLIGGWPLNLDFAWPINSDGLNDDGVQFNFSFGAAF